RPLLLPATQSDMKVVAVEAEVEDVESAHGGPAVLVGKGDGCQVVLLHLLAQRFEVVPVGWNLVVARGEHVFAVEDRPWVVRRRHRVYVAVVTLHGCRKALSEVALHIVPDIFDKMSQYMMIIQVHA